MKKTTIIIGTVVVILALVGAWSLLSKKSPSFGAANYLNSYPCSTVTATTATVTNGSSSQLLATSSRRAWAQIQLPQSATNTVSISINNDIAATANKGLVLSSGTTTALVLGLSTDLPYTGAVQGISSTGGSIVLITTCAY